MAATVVTNDEQHRELTNEEDFQQVYSAKVVNIMSTLRCKSLLYS